MTAVLLLHGWQNERPPEHWQTIVAAELRGRGVQVRHPQLPDPYEPVLEDWVAVARAELAELEGDDRVVVCHSLGCLLWAHANATADRVCWVAPPGPAFTAAEPAIAGFLLDPAAEEAVRAAPPRLVWSDGDPYCEEGAGPAYAEPLGLDADFVPGMAHLNPDAGLGEWPEMLAWCLDGSVRFRRGRP